MRSAEAALEELNTADAPFATAESSEVAEAEIAKGYIAAAHALPLEDGDPPLELPGLLIYERAGAIQASLARCLTKKEPHLLQIVIRIFSKLEELLPVYEAVPRLMKPLDHIAALLTPDVDQSSEIVEWHMGVLLGWVKETYTQESEVPMVDNLFRYSKGFWKGLFTCYDHYYVPRMNHDLEQFFRQTKKSYRRITGLRNWNSYIMRN